MVFTASVVVAASNFPGTRPAAVTAAAVTRKLRRPDDNEFEDIAILLVFDVHDFCKISRLMSPGSAVQTLLLAIGPGPAAPHY
jgi:hypothetical protein